MMLTAYQYSGWNRVVDKTSKLKKITQFDFVLKNTGVNILTPVILIKHNGYVNFNYCFIEEFNRYYFVINIAYISNDLRELQLRCDVLMTYTSSILSLNALIERNENEYNNLLKDELLPLRPSPIIEYDDSYISVNQLSFATYTSIQYYAVVLNTQLLEESHGATSNRHGKFQPMIIQNIAGNSVALIYAMNASNMARLRQKLIEEETLATFVIRLGCLPTVFDWEELGQKFSSIPISSNRNIENVECYLLNADGYIKAVNTIKIAPEYPSSFLDYQPYTKKELYIPLYGYIDINIDDLKETYTWLRYQFDLMNGETTVMLTKGTYSYPTGEIIFSSQCPGIINLGINSTNAQNVKNNNISNAISTSLATISAVGSIVTGNPIAIAGGAMGLAQAVGRSYEQIIHNYHKASVQTNSSISMYMMPYRPYFKIVKREMLLEDKTEYLKLYGGPLQKIKPLSEVFGYTIIDKVHVEGKDFILATETEKNEIETLLKSGVIL